MDKALYWLDPLGIRIILFLLIGGFWTILGVFVVPGLHTTSGKKVTSDVLFLSPKVDKEFFGALPEEVIAGNPNLENFRTIWMTSFSGAMVVAGILVISITWFGLRLGHQWALISLSLSILLALINWAFTLTLYIKAGISFGLFTMPPFIVIPALLIIPATVLGWIGLK